MRISLVSRGYGESKAKLATSETTDWLVAAAMGFAVLLTIAWNGLLFWLIGQLF
jgi:hypothetical protein